MMGILIAGLLLVPLALVLHLVYWSLRNGIGPMPSSPAQTRAIFDCLEDPPPGSRIYDLGSGFGTLALALARRFPGCRITGVENSPLPYVVSRLLPLLSRRQNLHYQRSDFLRMDLSDADIVVCYLFPGGMQRLKDKLERELRPGTAVVSNTFAVNSWSPERTLSAGRLLFASKIYLYRIPQQQRRPATIP